MPGAGTDADYDFGAGNRSVRLSRAEPLARGSVCRTGTSAVRSLQARARELHALAIERIGSSEGRPYISGDAGILTQNTA